MNRHLRCGSAPRQLRRVVAAVPAAAQDRADRDAVRRWRRWRRRDSSTGEQWWWRGGGGGTVTSTGGGGGGERAGAFGGGSRTWKPVATAAQPAEAVWRCHAAIIRSAATAEGSSSRSNGGRDGDRAGSPSTAARVEGAPATERRCRVRRLAPADDIRRRRLELRRRPRRLLRLRLQLWLSAQRMRRRLLRRLL